MLYVRNADTSFSNVIYRCFQILRWGVASKVIAGDGAYYHNDMNCNVCPEEISMLTSNHVDHVQLIF
jgi:hypothetical protein